MQSAKINHSHVTSLFVSADQVTATATWNASGNSTLSADHTIPLELSGGDDDDIVDASQAHEIQLAGEAASAGAVVKLQALVDAKFGMFKAKDGSPKWGPATAAKVGEKAAARPLAACEAVEPVLPWTERTDIRVEDLPRGKAIVFPYCRLDTLEDDIQRLVGQRLPIARYVEIAGPGVGWKIGHECLPLGKAIGFTSYELDRHLMGMIGKQSEGDPDKLWDMRIAPVYQRFFADMKVSIPVHMHIQALEDKIRKIVDGRTTWTRQLRGEAGWHIAGEFISLESVLNSSDRSFTSRLHGIVAART